MTAAVMPIDQVHQTDPLRVVNDVFEETALMLGGLLVVHGVDDDFVWRFVKNFDAIRCRAMQRIGECTPPVGVTELRSTPHPAVEDFLQKLHRS